MSTVTAHLYNWNRVQRRLLARGFITFDTTALNTTLTSWGYGTTPSSTFGQSGNLLLRIYPSLSDARRIAVLSTANTWEFIYLDDLTEQNEFMEFFNAMTEAVVRQAQLNATITGNVTGNVTGNATTATTANSVQHSLTVMSADGAITLKRGLLQVTKGSICVMTIADPINGTDDGCELVITSRTAFAHTLTYTGGFFNAGASFDVATFAPTGGTITLVATAGRWHIKSTVGVVIS